MATLSLLILLMARSVCILLECFFVWHNFCRKLDENEKQLDWGVMHPSHLLDSPITYHTDRYTKRERGGVENNRNVKNLLISHQPMGYRITLTVVKKCRAVKHNRAHWPVYVACTVVDPRGHQRCPPPPSHTLAPISFTFHFHAGLGRNLAK